MADAEQIFKEGLTHYRNGYWGKALEKLREAVDLDKQNSTYVAYLSLLVALATKGYDEAEKLGHLALKLDRKNVQAYLNLSEVYVRARRKGDAVEALREGLKFTKRDKRLLKALEKVGLRKPPVLSFLGRSHPINKTLGRMRYKLSGGGKKR
jgi:tetratricopeptide (TPR) repeat protein